MEQLSDDEIAQIGQQEVSVCLQIPSGERLMDTFPTSSSLGQVVDRWGGQLGQPGEGEQPVVVYMRREVVGRQELDTVSLRTLGLLQGKGLFRFFYKQPEQLKVQANVYEMKEKEKSAPVEVPHVPMRINPDNKVEETPVNDNDAMDTSTNVNSVEPEPEKKETFSQPLATDSEEKRKSEISEAPAPCRDEMEVSDVPDSTQPEPIINFVGPNSAVIFSATDNSPQYQDIDDDFFELSLDEVKGMYKELKNEVKRLTEGEMLMTREMRESQKESDRLSMLSKYKSCVLRIQFPCRHVVQGIFSPDTTIAQVLTWLAPVLASPDTPHELYTAPPRTSLPAEASIMDLNLFPAALVHFSSLVTKHGVTHHLSDEAMASLSNIQGANSVASQARRRIGGNDTTKRVSENEEEEIFRQPSR